MTENFRIQSSIQIDTAYVEEQLNAVRQRFEELRARLTQPIPISQESLPLPNAPRTDETAPQPPPFIPEPLVPPPANTSQLPPAPHTTPPPQTS